MSLLALSLIVAGAAAAAPVRIAQIQIEQRTVVRVRQALPASTPQRIRWTEKKGPKCVQMSNLAGASVSGPASIDLFLRGGVRVRAKLEKSCPSIDFYSGFYVKPTKDGRVCKGRDLFHSRTGGECEIEDFKTLVPAK